MAFRWLKSLFGSREPPWPADLPRLYPNLDTAQLCQFLSEPDYRHFRRARPVLVLPLLPAASCGPDAMFSLALSRLLIRDLMLVRTLSVRGTEDTPTASVHELAEGDRYLQRHIVIAVDAGRLPTGFRADLIVRHPEGGEDCRHVVGRKLQPLTVACAAAATEILEHEVDPETAQRWEVGRPHSLDQLLEFGALCTMPVDAERSEHATRLWRSDKRFVLPLHLRESYDVASRPLFLEGMNADPFDAQLMFCLFCSVFRGTTAQPEAVQFLRRAVELAPGLGKAHMAAPHAAPARLQPNMLRHSELGYRLLPGNNFAVTNYMSYLRHSGAPAREILKLGKEAIANDPEDPGAYTRMIEVCIAEHDYDTALKLAKQVDALMARMSERTRYCLMQNPENAQRLRDGTWDPAADIHRLHQLLRRLKAEKH
jgi:hypothetical protein